MLKAKKEVKRSMRYHNAAYETFLNTLSDDIQSGRVELQDEHRLSEDALRIDMMIIKKMPGVEIDRVWGKFMRGYNIIEYKSPAGPAPSVRVFDKVVHGYAGIYAAQHNVWLTDMTVTIICAKKPVKLFKTLEKFFGYEILRGDAGIYYIRLKGVPIEEMLAVQVVVCSELPDSEFMLKALVPDIGEDTAKRVLSVLDSGVDDKLSYWAEVVIEKNLNTIVEAGIVMRKKDMEKVFDKYGYIDAWRQEGWQEGLEAEKRRTAGVLLARGTDVDTVSQITGLTVDEISNLQSGNAPMSVTAVRRRTGQARKGA